MTSRVSQLPLAIVITAAIIVSYNYVYSVHLRTAAAGLLLHRQIVGNTALSPYSYRVLVPLVADPLLHLLERLTHAEKVAFIATYGLYSVLAITFSLLILYRLCRRWFSSFVSLFGILVTALSMVAASRDHYFQPWSLLEPGLFALAFLLILDGRMGLVAALTVLATLNRETALIIPCLCACVPLGRWSTRIWRAAPALLAWFAVFAGVRIRRGPHAMLDPVARQWQLNTEPVSLMRTGVAMVAFLGVFWLVLFIRPRDWGREIRRASLVLPMYCCTIAVFGLWWETRYLMSMYFILIPAILNALVAALARSEGAALTYELTVAEDTAGTQCVRARIAR